MSIEAGDPANASLLTTDVHVGTHIDAPLHFIPGGGDMESMSLASFIGPAIVVDVRGAIPVTAEMLDCAAIAAGTERLLIRANTDADRYEGEFDPDFNALAPSAAGWIVDHGIKLVGIDYLSVQRFTDGPETHQLLLGAGVAILEGLDLSAVEPGEYELLCLPVRLEGAEAAPARAVLRRID